MLAQFVRYARPVVLAAVTLSCSNTLGPHTVSDARSLWESRNISTYSYIGTKTCFCTGSGGPVRVDVINGKFAKATVLETGSIDASPWPTVEDLFDLAQHAQPVRIAFDKHTGFPTVLEMCCLANDSGVRYTVSGLTPH
jgi:hypothetical protein